MQHVLKFSLASRMEANGRINHISKGLGIPDLVDLIFETAEGKFALACDAIVQQIHAFVKEQRDLDLLADYNALFNRWQDGLSYKSSEVLLPLAIPVISDAQKLLAQLVFKLRDAEIAFNRENWDWAIKLKAARQLQGNARLYMGSLLCLIQSKMRIEIESFKHDSIVAGHAELLRKTAEKLLHSTVGYISGPGDPLRHDSLIYMLALQEETEEHADLFTCMLSGVRSGRDLALMRLREAPRRADPDPNPDQSGMYPLQDCRVVKWNCIARDQVECAHIFRELLLQAQSFAGFILKLSEADVILDTTPEHLIQLESFVHRHRPSF